MAINRIEEIESRAAMTLERLPSRTVKYEDICEKPLLYFEEIFGWAGLQYDNTVKDFILRTSQANVTDGYRSDTYGTKRNSRHMKDAWKLDCSEEDAQEFERLYKASSLTTYRDPEYWLR